jgi:hypothetical protein
MQYDRSNDGRPGERRAGGASPKSQPEEKMKYLPQVDPVSLKLTGLKILGPEDLVAAVLAILDRFPLFDDGMEVLGRPIL